MDNISFLIKSQREPKSLLKNNIFINSPGMPIKIFITLFFLNLLPFMPVPIPSLSLENSPCVGGYSVILLPIPKLCN